MIGELTEAFELRHRSMQGARLQRICSRATPRAGYIETKEQFWRSQSQDYPSRKCEFVPVNTDAPVPAFTPIRK